MCTVGAASGSHAHPCLRDVTQADAIPGICKLSLLSPWGGGARRGPSSPAPTVTLGPTPQERSWKEGIFESWLCLALGSGPPTAQRKRKAAVFSLVSGLFSCSTTWAGELGILVWLVTSLL